MPMILSEWPSTATRGRHSRFAKFLDGVIYKLDPKEFDYLTVADLRNGVNSAAASRRIKLRCHAAPDGTLVVQGLGKR